MELTPMRFKDYVFPHNPTVYSIAYEQHMSVLPVPGGHDHVSHAGMGHRVMRGQGELVGAGAYDEFKKLASVFYDATPGILVHPVWQTSQAYFVELSLAQEPRPDYVRYSFAFWEALYKHDTALTLTEQAEQTEPPAAELPRPAAVFYTVCKGDTLWAIAQKYGMTLEELVAKNPQIKNPNLIAVGQSITVG